MTMVIIEVFYLHDMPPQLQKPIHILSYYLYSTHNLTIGFYFLSHLIALRHATWSGLIFDMAENNTTLDPMLLWWLQSNKPSHETKSKIYVTMNTHNRSSIERVVPHVHALHLDIQHNEHDLSPVCFPLKASLRGSAL